MSFSSVYKFFKKIEVLSQAFFCQYLLYKKVVCFFWVTFFFRPKSVHVKESLLIILCRVWVNFTKFLAPKMTLCVKSVTLNMLYNLSTIAALNRKKYFHTYFCALHKCYGKIDICECI